MGGCWFALLTDAMDTIVAVVGVGNGFLSVRGYLLAVLADALDAVVGVVGVDSGDWV